MHSQDGHCLEYPLRTRRALSLNFDLHLEQHIKPRIAIVVMSGRPGKDDQEYGVLASGMGAHAPLN